MRTLGGFPVRLAGAFIVVVLLLGATSLLTLRSVVRSSGERDIEIRQSVRDVILAERLRGEEEHTVAVSRGYLIAGSPDFLERLAEAEAAFDDLMVQLDQHVRSPEGRLLLLAVTEAAREYEQSIDRIISIRRSGGGGSELIQDFQRDVGPRRQRLDGAIDAFLAHKERRMAAAYAQAGREATRASVVGIVTLSGAVALSALLSWILGRRLVGAYRREQEAVRVAEHAVAARDELMGIVAHDLRSPLSAIAMKATLLRKTSPDERIRKGSEVIESIVSRMEHIIKSLLDTASIEAGRFSVQPVPSSVDDLLQGVVETFGALASSKSVRLEVLHPETPVGVMADRERALQVLTNLVGNAVKFTPAGGAVRVSVDRTGGMVRFGVSDTGPGIRPEHVPHLFERFWKAEKGDKKGTGLGLYIVKGIIDAHHGSIWVESAPGTGTSFYFTLASTEPPRAPERAGVSAPPAQG